MALQVRGVFDEMLANGLTPSIVAVNTLLASYAALGAWAEALEALTHAMAAQVEGVNPNTCEQCRRGHWASAVDSWAGKGLAGSVPLALGLLLPDSCLFPCPARSPLISLAPHPTAPLQPPSTPVWQPWPRVHTPSPPTSTHTQPPGRCRWVEWVGPGKFACLSPAAATAAPI